MTRERMEFIVDLLRYCNKQAYISKYHEELITEIFRFHPEWRIYEKI